MRRSEAQQPLAAIPQAKQNIAHDRITPAFAPQLDRLHHRHQQLLSTGGIHLFADDLPDLLLCPECQREQAVHAGGELLNEAGAQHKLVADGIGISRDFPLGTAEKTRETHCFPPGGSFGLGRGSKNVQRSRADLGTSSS